MAENFANRFPVLVNLRRRAGITQSEIVRRAGMWASQIGQAERGCFPRITPEFYGRYHRALKAALDARAVAGDLDARAALDAMEGTHGG